MQRSFFAIQRGYTGVREQLRSIVFQKPIDGDIKSSELTAEMTYVIKTIKSLEILLIRQLFKIKRFGMRQIAGSSRS
jgi:hypothetical protein